MASASDYVTSSDIVGRMDWLAAFMPAEMEISEGFTVEDPAVMMVGGDGIVKATSAGWEDGEAVSVSEVAGEESLAGRVAVRWWRFGDPIKKVS